MVNSTKRPFTTKQKEVFSKGASGDTKLAPHHRDQIPTEQGGANQQQREIKEYWRKKGDRLEEIKPDVWIDP